MIASLGNFGSALKRISFTKSVRAKINGALISFPLPKRRMIRHNSRLCSLLIAFFRRMSLYERFNDETEFRENFVKPLLNRLGYYGVSKLHGTQEFGKDFVFSELHR